ARHRAGARQACLHRRQRRATAGRHGQGDHGGCRGLRAAGGRPAVAHQAARDPQDTSHNRGEPMMRPRTPLLAAGLWTLAAVVPLGLAAADAPMPAGKARLLVQDGPSAQAALPDDSTGAGAAQDAGRATALTEITVTEEQGDVLVRLAGDGRLTASSVQVPDGAPPRLALDF